MKLFTILFLSTSVAILVAQNPISPPGTYIADPSVHVWNDGKMYVYGSLDISCDHWCSWTHHVMVTDDMVNWKIVENVFSSKGENDQVPYSDKLLFAPDCAEKNGSYYMYYCMPSNEHAEGVAFSENPAGPFVNGQKLDLAGHEQIDPSVFIDDDGQVYYIWGQFTLKMARMKKNMKELDLSTLKDSIITEEDHHFHEGAYMTRRGGMYYLIYADISRAEMPTCIGYAMSESPFGPYEYGGVIVDNDQCNPNNWNNHGSIAKLNNQWYVFYHRSTHGCAQMRKACVEPIWFNEDGTIDEVEMTTQGAAPPLPATSVIDAERACILQGNVRIEMIDEKNEMLTNIENYDKVFYKYIDFNHGVQSVSMKILPGKNGGTINLSVGQPWYKKLADIHIEPSMNNDWQVISQDVEDIEGIHALCLQFYGEKDIVDLDWIKFNE